MWRQYHKDDMIDTEEGRQFRIEALIRRGGSSAVYRAEERIGKEKRPVLLKAFYTEDQMASREEKEAWIRHELKMSRQIQDSGFSGALTIDYPVHGRYDKITYGVMAADRLGQTLSGYVSSKKFFQSTLRDRLELCRQLFHLVEHFHEKCRMIHGDISPNNLFLLDSESSGDHDDGRTMVLLDFGLAQSLDSFDETVPTGGTEGYTHPELLCGQRTALRMSDDGYSVSACAWTCFSGHPPDKYEITDEHIEAVCEHLALCTVKSGFTEGPDLVEMQFLQAQEARQRSILTLLKDMFLGPRGELRRLIELADAILAVLDESGIDRGRLTASLCEEYLELRQERFSHVDIISRILPHVDFQADRNPAMVSRSRQGRPEPLHQMIHNCTGSLFMIGDGGMGKTTSLLQIMDDTYRSDRLDIDDPVIFLELYTLSQDPDDWYSPELGGTFIEQFVASYFTQRPRRYMSKGHPYIGPIREEFFRVPTDGEHPYTILLDGVNEVGFSSEHDRRSFIDSLNHYLGHAHNLRIILTGRSDIYELNSQYIQRIYTKGLDDLTIEEVLVSAVEQGRLTDQEYCRIIEGHHDFFSNDYRLWQCLQIPFFLMMYCMTEEKSTVSRQGEILRNFFNDKRDSLDGSQTYGEKQKGQQRHGRKKYRGAHKLRMDLSLRTILDFIVPEIALQMVVGDTHFIRLEQVNRVIKYCLDPNRSQSQYQHWCRWYYGYDIDVQSIFDEIRRIDGGEQIVQYICDVLGVMRESSDQTLSFTHQYFRDYFAACALIGRILTVLELKTKADHLTANNEVFSLLIYPFQLKLFSSHICSLVGEILNESHNIPVFYEADRTWKLPDMTVPEQAVLSQLLECYRVAPQGTLDKKTATGFKNLIEIFKGSRVQNDGRVDFSGMALHHLDLADIYLSDVILSRYNGDGAAALTADLTGSIHLEKALFPNGDTLVKRCIAAHPTQKRILLWNEWDKSVTEYDLDHEEMTSICSDIGQIHSAFYRQSDDSIFIVCCQPIQCGGPDTAPERTKIISKIVTRPSVGGKQQLDRLEQEVQLHIYSKKKKPVIHPIAYREQVIGSDWSEHDQELSLFLQNVDGVSRLVVVKVLTVFQMNGEMVRQSLITSSTSFPQKLPFFDPDSAAGGQGTFMFSRTKEGWYVLASPNWPGNVCFYDVLSAKNSSLLYISESKKKGVPYAICSEGDSRSFYLLNGTLIMTSGSVYPLGIEPFQYSLSTCYGRLELLPAADRLLCLDHSRLLLINAKTMDAIWTADPLIDSYFWCCGTLIANGKDGIYEVDILDGSSTCIQYQAQVRHQFITGIASDKAQILLLDDSGIIKWIDVHTGCCVRHSTIQLQGLDDITDLQICAKQGGHQILGLKGRRVYVWDDCTGRLKFSEVIPEFPNGAFLWAELVRPGILVYLSIRDHSVFPLQIKYSCKIWDLEGHRWEDVNASYINSSSPFRLHFAEEGGAYSTPAVLEHYYHRQKVHATVQVRKRKWRASKGRASIDPLASIDSLIERRADPVEPNGPDTIEWIPELWDKVLDQEGYTLDARLEYDEPQTRRIGLTNGKLIYAAVKDPSSVCDFWVDGHSHKMKFRLVQLSGCQIKHALATDDIAVFHVYDRNRKTEDIIFWDTETRQIYSHHIAEGVAAAGCVTDDEAGPQELQDMFYMQGLGGGERNDLGTSVDISIRNTLESRDLEERMSAWDLGTLLFFIALTTLNSCVNFAISDVLSAWRYFGGIFLKTAVFFPILLFTVKLMLPRIVIRPSWREIYGIAYPVLMLGLGVVFLIFFRGDAIRYLTRSLVLLGLPFIAVHIMYSSYISSLISSPLFIVGIIMSFLTGLINISENIYYLETHCLAVIVIIVMTWIRAKDKTQFLRSIMIAVVLLAAIDVAMIVLGHGLEIDALIRKIARPESQEQIAGYCREVWLAAKPIGPAGIPEPAFFVDSGSGAHSGVWYDYIGHYFLNHMAGNYGLLAMYMSILLTLVLILSMLIGIRKQESALDRYVCASCTLFITIEAVLGILGSIGLNFIPPNCMPFLSGVPGLCYGDHLALCIYMAFYRAHKQPD